MTMRGDYVMARDRFGVQATVLVGGATCRPAGTVPRPRLELQRFWRATCDLGCIYDPMHNHAGTDRKIAVAFVRCCPLRIQYLSHDFSTSAKQCRGCGMGLEGSGLVGRWFDPGVATKFATTTKNDQVRRSAVVTP